MCTIRCFDHFLRFIDTSNFVPFLRKIHSTDCKSAVSNLFFNLTNFCKIFRNCCIDLNEGPLLKSSILKYIRQFSQFLPPFLFILLLKDCFDHKFIIKSGYRKLILVHETINMFYFITESNIYKI